MRRRSHGRDHGRGRRRAGRGRSAGAFTSPSCHPDRTNPPLCGTEGGQSNVPARDRGVGAGPRRRSVPRPRSSSLRAPGALRGTWPAVRVRSTGNLALTIVNALSARIDESFGPEGRLPSACDPPGRPEPPRSALPTRIGEGSWAPSQSAYVPAGPPLGPTLLASRCEPGLHSRWPRRTHVLRPARARRRRPDQLRRNPPSVETGPSTPGAPSAVTRHPVRPVL